MVIESFLHFYLQKYLAISEKVGTFAPAFEEKTIQDGGIAQLVRALDS